MVYKQDAAVQYIKFLLFYIQILISSHFEEGGLELVIFKGENVKV